MMMTDLVSAVRIWIDDDYGNNNTTTGIINVKERWARNNHKKIQKFEKRWFHGAPSLYTHTHEHTRLYIREREIEPLQVITMAPNWW
jgi:ABC-type nitrate/sulfonate/bicarbonate transport system substrate-binding protein